MPREWERTTTAAGFAAVPNAIVERFAEDHGIDRPGADVTLCVNTDSVPVRRGLLGRRAKPTTVLAALDSELLYWAQLDPGATPFLAAARLADIEVASHRSSLIEDSGVDVTGFRLGGSGERETWFIGLGDQPEADAFRTALIAATTRA